MKTRANYLVLLFLLIVIQANAQDRYQATWESLKNYECPDWFRDAKFGIFIHWGVYSVPAFESEWYPRLMYLKGSPAYKHHMETYGSQKDFGYKDFIPMFKAEKFDANEWISLFIKAGAKYVVPVAEHHDGFAMYKTSLSKWNAAEMGPHRDIVGELADAAKKQGMIFGLSSHRIEHWWFLQGGRKFESDVMDPQYADFYGPAREENETMSPEFMNDWLLRSVELVDKYQPQLFWFDWWIEQPALEPYRKSFAAYYYNKGLEWNKGVAINYKNSSFPDGTAVYDIERGSSKAGKKYPWQTDTSIGKKSWGYIPGEENKSPNELIDELVDIVSKNGNLLLNIGPRPDGTITREQQDVLLAIGKWLKINGEGIYGTRPWDLFGEGPTQMEGESFNEGSGKGFTEKDIRFTGKGDLLYAYLLDIPREKIVIKSLAAQSKFGKVAGVELLGSTEKIVWVQKPEGLVIQPSKTWPGDCAIGYKIIK
ncbi:MAG: alpha-L-fucosidase [Porphyromonadaceae bacterium]|nr:MAG: alpha-L-fucosidase [Porphyromonadaceae bacterium]